MDQEFVDKLGGYLHNHKPKYHLVVTQPFGISSRYNGEHHNLDYIVEIAHKVLGEDYFLNSQCMLRAIADSLRVHPSALVIPQGHGDINVISNLKSHFGGALPDIPIFNAIKNTGDYCNENGSLKNPYMKKEKDELVQSAYKTWLLDSVKSKTLNLSEL